MSNLNSIPMPTDPRFQDLTGRAFSRWSVLAYAGRNSHKHVWLCNCECGREKVVDGQSLKAGLSKSCGCLKGELAKQKATVHGSSGTPEHTAWLGMWERCTNPKHKSYPAYAARVPSVEFEQFERFLEEVGKKPSPAHSLDRVDNKVGYIPGNLRWTTSRRQANNTSANVHITYRGVTRTMAEWARYVGMAGGTLWYRLKVGWSVERALTEEVRR